MADENIFYNVNITNPNDYPNVSSFQANYYEERLQPFLSDPDKYELKIIKFSVPAEEIPIIIADMQIGSNPQITNWSIGYQNGNNFKTIFLPYVTDEAGKTANPSPILDNEYRHNSYYWIYSYQHMIEIMNNGLISAAGQTGSTGAISGPLPYFLYDSATQLLSCIIPRGFTWQIIVNTPLHNYLVGFNLQYNGTGLPNNNDFAIDPYGYDTDYFPPSVGNTGQASPYIQIIQEFNSMIYWFSLKNIIFTSATLPITNETLSSRYGQSSGNSSPVLIDFTPDLTLTSTPRSILNYYDPGNDRWISMNHSIGLKKLQLSIFWQDILGFTYPIEIPYKQQLQIKLLFRKKLIYRTKEKEYLK
jgi:hypothetical protein